jgi:hypothetical protein
MFSTQFSVHYVDVVHKFVWMNFQCSEDSLWELITYLHTLGIKMRYVIW